jgi:hypothetical protein
MRYYLVVASLAMVVAVDAAAAQTAPKKLDLRPTVAAYLPMGDQADALGKAVALGFGVGYALRPTVSIVGNFAWAPSHDLTRPTEDFVGLYQLDLGAEANLGDYLPGIFVRPIIGAGAGFRRFSPVAKAQEAINKPVFHATIGLEIPFDQVFFRVAARNNFVNYAGLDPEDSPVPDGMKHDILLDFVIRVPLR